MLMPMDDDNDDHDGDDFWKIVLILSWVGKGWFYQDRKCPGIEACSMSDFYIGVRTWDGTFIGLEYCIRYPRLCHQNSFNSK